MCPVLIARNGRAGNKQAREGTATFLIQHSSERNHFIVSNTVCVATLA